jgi:LmbE family N-acetylglucosaminyl deacetylase
MASLLAVLAHPDDDVTIGPLLASYAQKGASVTLAYLASGQAGGNLIGPERGDALGALREDEARAASRAYGIAEPIFLRAQDGTLATLSPAELGALTERVGDLLHDLEPDAIITFGPDGYTRHSDHKATCSLVTDLLQRWPAEAHVPELYYISLTERAADALARGGFPSHALAWVQDGYITTEIDASDGISNAIAALRCYRSQFAPSFMTILEALITETMGGHVALRRAFVRLPLPQRERTLLSSSHASR